MELPRELGVHGDGTGERTEQAGIGVILANWTEYYHRRKLRLSILHWDQSKDENQRVLPCSDLRIEQFSGWHHDNVRRMDKILTKRKFRRKNYSMTIVQWTCLIATIMTSPMHARGSGGSRHADIMAFAIIGRLGPPPSIAEEVDHNFTQSILDISDSSICHG